jgi:site-specific DNA-cytosine methylase
MDHFPGAFMARGVDDVPANMMPGSIDFAAGHPECGRYSTLSHSVQLGTYQESRGSDVSDIPLFLKLVANLRPRFFLMDDLPASFGPLPMSEYAKMLPDYDLFPEWISNWGYGNIQKYRNRMFIVGALKAEKFTFVPGEQEHGLVLSDVIGRFLTTQPGEVPNHAFVDPSFVPGRYVNMRWYGERSSWGELSELFKDGEWFKNLKYYSPDGTQKVRPGTTNPRWDGFCPVLSGGYNPIHPIRRNPLTIRERAAIQGFPDDFLFHHDEEGIDREVWEPYNSDGQRGIKQTGKAMPLQFCTYVADQVKHHIEGKPFKASGKRLLKANPMVTKAKEDFCRISGYADQEAACATCWHRAECPLFLELRKAA